MSRKPDALKAKDFIAGAVIGGVLGAALALLTTPKSGREMREELNEKWDVAKDKGLKVYHQVKEQADEVKEQVQDKKIVSSGWMDLPTSKKEPEQQDEVQAHTEPASSEPEIKTEPTSSEPEIKTETKRV
ncbi:YtxH domain-containing protein [Hazenella sp. IB182357]|uniref:YtxH domain-containing protein n=1 Tax=Polycladospora coralii TaxID=2771432 RepID=A0A926N4S7_9BACL|nr:YtxH domain-containing protein [Polycladospora coralii]MBD1370924.1 YtxH domain-containing protein [Polycladospora coralii]